MFSGPDDGVTVKIDSEGLYLPQFELADLAEDCEGLLWSFGQIQIEIQCGIGVLSLFPGSGSAGPETG